MRILLWHGYLLSGSGSNIHTANVTRAWRRQGHDVLLMCQERASRLETIDAQGDFAPDNSSYSLVPSGAPAAAGTCTLVRPAIGGLLPVYVYDEYEGFEVKRFVDLTDDELDDYTERNVVAMRTALESFEPDAVIIGHEVMGPYIARRACEVTGHRYVAKLHGSALEYAVRRQERYLGYAIEGLNGAACVVGGSRYMVDAAATIVPGWRERGRVVNPGVDVELFVSGTPRRARHPLVGYVGKLIAAKGVHELIAALGATKTEGLEAIAIGYGGDEVALQELSRALSAGDVAAARAVADGLDLSERLRIFLDDVEGTTSYRRRAAEIPVRFPGRLDHDELAPLLPTFDVLVVPSIVPEAFGMVAAEAAACGVLPLVPDHSGIGEVGRALEEHLGASGLLTFDPDDPIAGIASGIDRILALDPGHRAELGAAAAELARSRWSWDHVAEQLLAAATDP